MGGCGPECNGMEQGMRVSDVLPHAVAVDIMDLGGSESSIVVVVAVRLN